MITMQGLRARAGGRDSLLGVTGARCLRQLTALRRAGADTDSSGLERGSWWRGVWQRRTSE